MSRSIRQAQQDQAQLLRRLHHHGTILTLSSNSPSHPSVAASWLEEPAQRDVIDRRIIAEARAVVEDDPPDLADHTV